MVWELIKCDGDDEWEEYLKRSNGLVTIAHNPTLISFFSKYFGFDGGNYFLCKNKTEMAAIVLINTSKGFMSVPHLSYGGFISSNGLNPLEGFEALTGLLEGDLEIRSFDKLSEYCFDKKIATYLTLKDEIDAQFSDLTSNMRRKTRKAIKNGMNIQVGGLDLLSDFYSIYKGNMKKLGSPHFSIGFFKCLLESYGRGEAKIFCTYHEGKPIGGAFVLSYLDYFENCWFSTDQRFNGLYTSIYLYWEMIKYAVNGGYKYFSFGRSSENSSLLAFKRHWKPEERRLYFNYSAPQKLQLREQKYLSTCWRYLPGVFTDKLGPIIAERIY